MLKPDVGRNNESAREAWLEKALAAVPAKSRILDAGAGTQRYRRFCAHLNYVSQDFAQYDGQGDDAALQTGEFDYGVLDIVSDITAIPEDDASFDAIMCIEVLEHLPDPAGAIKEFSRLLKPDGHLIVTAPFCSLTHFAPYHFASGFNRYWYEHHLAENGFEDIELTANGNYFEYIAQETRRVKSMGKRYSGTKPRLLDRLSTYIMLRMLARLSERDSGSSELLCYGYHVYARKG